MKAYTVSQYKDAGCPEMENASMLAVHGITEGVVCPGCYAFLNGDCPHYQKLIKGHNGVDDLPGVAKETVRDEAKRRGISINTCRKERRDANLAGVEEAKAHTNDSCPKCETCGESLYFADNILHDNEDRYHAHDLMWLVEPNEYDPGVSARVPCPVGCKGES